MSKRILSFVLALVMVLATFPAITLPTFVSAETEEESNLWNVALDAQVTAGNGKDGNKVTDGYNDEYFDLGWIVIAMLVWRTGTAKRSCLWM